MKASSSATPARRIAAAAASRSGSRRSPLHDPWRFVDSRARRAGPSRFRPMSFASDDFALFDLPRRFALDAADLAARRRALQAEVHPDRFAAGGAAAQRAAMQWAVRVNEAYELLKDPLKRAAYLCELG